MRVAVFSSKRYDMRFLGEANGAAGHELDFLEARLDHHTAPLADGYPVVSAFVNDVLDAPVLRRLHQGGVGMAALRSAGFNHVDLDTARDLGITVARVPAYSPRSVAEHTVALMLALNRKIHRAYARVREGNFALDGLLGFDLGARTAGVVGTGLIGREVARLLRGFGCRVLGYDPYPNEEAVALGVEYTSLDDLFASSGIITLHSPLTPETRHLVGAATIARMRPGVMIINTGRGALIDTAAAIEALKDGHIGSMGLDVYEEEEGLFFEDLSDTVIQDDVFSRLLTFPNVLVTGHQAFFTEEALGAIAAATVGNITAFAEGRLSGNEL